MSMRLIKRGDLSNGVGYQRQVNNVFSHNFAILEFANEKEAQEFIDSHAFLAFPNTQFRFIAVIQSNNYLIMSIDLYNFKE